MSDLVGNPEDRFSLVTAGINLVLWLRNFSCSTQLRLIFILLINVIMSTNVGILTFIYKQDKLQTFANLNLNVLTLLIISVHVFMSSLNFMLN